MKRHINKRLVALCLAGVAASIAVAMWLRTHTVAEFPESPAHYGLLPDGRILWQAYDGPPRILDPATGRDQPATALIDAFRRDPQLARRYPNGPTDCIASPDGRWIINEAVMGDKTMLVLASIDGASTRTALVDTWSHPGRQSAWLWDSKGWVAVTGTSLMTYDLDGKIVNRQPVPEAYGPSSPILPGELVGSNCATDAGSLDLVRPGKAPVQIGSWDFTGSGDTEAALSPDGKQIAIIRSKDKSDPLLAVDNLDIFPFKLGSYRGIVQIMDVETRRIRTMSSVSHDGFSNIAWSRDGRSVTYLSGNQLLRTTVR